MADVFMSNPFTGRCALYAEPNTIGDPEDLSAPRNAPLNNPAAYLAQLYYHSDYDPMEVAIGPISVGISHAVIPAGTIGGGAGTVNGGQVYGGWAAAHVLLNHGLGIVPDFFLIVGNNEVHPGYPVQYDSVDGRARCVTAYATASQIVLYETGVQTGSAMPAISISYTLMVLRPPPAPSGNILFDFNPATGVVEMARGKFKSDRRYLQVVSGGTPFGFPLGRTIDLANGTFRSVTNGVARDVVPASFRVSFGSGNPNFGPNGNYNGGFTGDPFIQVQAP